MGIDKIIFNKWTDLIGGIGLIIGGVIILMSNVISLRTLWLNLFACFLIIFGIIWKQKKWCEKIAIYWRLKNI